MLWPPPDAHALQVGVRDGAVGRALRQDLRGSTHIHTHTFGLKQCRLLVRLGRCVCKLGPHTHVWGLQQCCGPSCCNRCSRTSNAAAAACPGLPRPPAPTPPRQCAGISAWHVAHSPHPVPPLLRTWMVNVDSVPAMKQRHATLRDQKEQACRREGVWRVDDAQVTRQGMGSVRGPGTATLPISHNPPSVRMQMTSLPNKKQ